MPASCASAPASADPAAMPQLVEEIDHGAGELVVRAILDDELHFVAGRQIEAVGKEVHADRGVLRDRDFVGLRIDERADGRPALGEQRSGRGTIGAPDFWATKITPGLTS